MPMKDTTRRRSFVHDSMHDSDAGGGLHRSQSRRAWLFRRTGVSQYKDVLRSYRKRGSDNNLSRNGSSGREDRSSQPPPTRRRSELRPAGIAERSFSAWVGLYDAPLFVSSLGDPINQVRAVLSQYIRGLQAGETEAQLNTDLVRLSALIGTACEGTEAIELHIDPMYLEKCTRLSKVASEHGFANRRFTPPLDLSRAEALFAALSETPSPSHASAANAPDTRSVDTEVPKANAAAAAADTARGTSAFSKQDIVITNAPEESFFDARKMTVWEKVQADVWVSLKPQAVLDGGASCDRLLLHSIVQLTLLLGWIFFYIIRTLPQFHDPSPDIARRWYIAEACFEIYYTLEWFLRLIAAPQKTLYLKQTTTMLTLLALFPFYIKWIYRFSGGEYVTHTGFIGHVDMFTVLRVFKFTGYMGSHLDNLRMVIRASSWMLIIGVITLVVFILIMSNVLFFVETASSMYTFDEVNGEWHRQSWPEDVINGTIVTSNVISPFQSMFDAYWWCIATVTTVGYGDRYPITTGGRLAAGMCMVVGVLVFAVPASVICSHFTITKTDDTVGEASAYRKAVRGYVRKICRRTLAWEPFAPIMLHHFIMLDSLEMEHLKNPLSVDLSDDMYQRFYWLYKAAMFKEKCLFEEMGLDVHAGGSSKRTSRPVLSMESDSSTNASMSSFAASEATSVASTVDSSSEDEYPHDDDEQRKVREQIRLYCQWRFANNCAEVFRSEQDRLWRGYAEIKQKEANKM